MPVSSKFKILSIVTVVILSATTIAFGVLAMCSKNAPAITFARETLQDHYNDAIVVANALGLSKIYLFDSNANFYEEDILLVGTKTYPYYRLSSNVAYLNRAASIAFESALQFQYYFHLPSEIDELGVFVVVN